MLMAGMPGTFKSRFPMLLLSDWAKANCDIRPFYSSDWGDYISFSKRMSDLADERGVDLILVDTGDRVEGNGLYDADKPKGDHTSKIFQEQKIDVICSGNHELYKKHTADNEYLVTVPNSKGNYLASNIDIIDPRTGNIVPLAPRFRLFTTRNQGIRILAFGFLFDFTGNYNNTFVQPVEKTVQEQWFQDAIRGTDIDLILTVGHVPVRSKEYRALHTAIRDVRWDTPIVFLGGHSHIRDYAKYDSKAWALESGRYMETIGWMSVEGIRKDGQGDKVVTTNVDFDRKYIDNNLFSFYHHTGLNSSTFPTEHGLAVSRYIAQARKALNLDELIGCAPQNYWLTRAAFPSKDSIFSWLQDSVLPDITREHDPDEAKLVIVNTGAMRFDIFEGPFTKDTTYIVSPFTGGFRRIKNVPYDKAKQILLLLNNEMPRSQTADSKLDISRLALPEQLSPKSAKPIVKAESVRYSHQMVIEDDIAPNAHLQPGYTTIDDAGKDGDDTIHSPISSFQVPNCIQAEVSFPENGNEPESVELIFLAFIEPWILYALKFLGEEYGDDDVGDYAGGESFTLLMSDWVRRYWKGSC